MPDVMPARPPLAEALEQGLAALFRSLQAEPAPASLIILADQLEDAWRGAQAACEPRAIG